MGSRKKVAVLFPGQGSQYIGMAKEFVEKDSEARAMLAMAESVSKLPLTQLCLEGPITELTRTLHLQPAMTVTNLICWLAASKAGLVADYFAGHSLGEYSALCAAGVLTSEDAILLVTERGKLMERESQKNPGSMRAVLGLTIDEVTAITAEAGNNGVVTAANYNSEKQIVISGQMASLDAATELIAGKGGKVVPLPVSGAWHSQLVAEAIPDFTIAINMVTFNVPSVPIFFNVTGRSESDPAVIQTVMAKQIAAMVKWYDIVKEFVAQEVRVFIEIGPKNVLTGLVKKIVPKDYEHVCFQIDTPEKLDQCLTAIN